jgi:hypothetical protein
MPLRKSWRWIGAFDPSLMLCVGSARVGVLRRSWWAVWDGVALHEGTRGVTPPVSRVAVRDGGVALDLALAGGTAVRASDAVAFTVKTPLRVTGSVALGSRRFAVDAPGLSDFSGGRHARRTSWLWAAGAGMTVDGRPVYWNLVDGMFVGECCVWVDGVPHLVGTLPFDGLRGVGGLSFTPLATRAHRENYLVLMSDYEQPFGVFAGSLPVAGELAYGHGVMERHEALW